MRVTEGAKTEICNVKSWDQADWLLWKILGEIKWCVTGVDQNQVVQQDNIAETLFGEDHLSSGDTMDGVLPR